jgi:hypothetical protein
VLTNILNRSRASIDDVCAHSSEGLRGVHRLVRVCLEVEGPQYNGNALTAVVDWFKRRHSGSGTSTAGGIGGGVGDDDSDGSGNSGRKLRRIMAALEELDRLVRIPCFAARPNVLADEVQFLKTAGDRRHTIELLCEVARRWGDLADTAPALAALLKRKTIDTVDDYFKSDQSARRAKWIVGVVTAAVPVAKGGACVQ